MFNKVIMVGNLVRDIELRYLPNGTPVATSAIASNKKYKAPTGELKEETCFIDVTFWGRTAEVVNQYLKKGSKILIEGELKLDRWQDQMGQNRSKHSVTVTTMQMLDTRGSGQNPYGNEYSQNSQNSSMNQNNYQNSYQNMQSNDSQGFSSNNKIANNKQNFGNTNIPEIDIDEDDIPF